MPKYYSTKTYNTDRGLSCCFRQWRATHSHCSTIHGYSIGIKLIFETETLDDKNWAMDFGGLKKFKEWADWQFDHTLIVAKDDPELELFKQLDGKVATLRIVDAVGCEKFAELAYRKMEELLKESKRDDTLLEPWCAKIGAKRYPVNPHVRLKSVEVFEHGANSAIFEG